LKEAERLALKFGKQQQKSLDNALDKADIQFLGYETKIRLRDGTKFLKDKLENAKT